MPECEGLVKVLSVKDLRNYHKHGLNLKKLFLKKRGNNIFDRFKQVQEETRNSRGGAIEYFLTKLKRVDDEMMTSSAELREINEEISRKEFNIEMLKMKLENLMREEMNRDIRRLEQMKTELKENVKKADRVLAGLGLIWVGEHAAGTNTDRGIRFIGSPEGAYYRPDPGYHEINNQLSPVTPFTGHGYRLGTGSEIFEQQANESDQSSGQRQSSNSPSSRHSEGGSVSTGQNQANLLGESPSLGDSPRPEPSRTSSEHRIRQANALGSARVKSLEELPLEFRLMSKSERRRALKQVSVQIQKNMNKYTI